MLQTAVYSNFQSKNIFYAFEKEKEGKREPKMNNFFFPFLQRDMIMKSHK